MFSFAARGAKARWGQESLYAWTQNAHPST